MKRLVQAQAISTVQLSLVKHSFPLMYIDVIMFQLRIEETHHQTEFEPTNTSFNRISSPHE